jgi:hypothetical protein
MWLISCVRRLLRCGKIFAMRVGTLLAHACRFPACSHCGFSRKSQKFAPDAVFGDWLPSCIRDLCKASGLTIAGVGWLQPVSSVGRTRKLRFPNLNFPWRIYVRIFRPCCGCSRSYRIHHAARPVSVFKHEPLTVVGRPHVPFRLIVGPGGSAGSK